MSHILNQDSRIRRVPTASFKIFCGILIIGAIIGGISIFHSVNLSDEVSSIVQVIN